MYTQDELELLTEWREKVGGWRWLHYESMNLYKKLNTRYVYASILLSTFAGAGSFTTGGGTGNAMGMSDRYVSYLIGGVNVVISLLNSFQRFTKAAEKTELHASAAMQYAMIYRFIDTELQLSEKHQRQDLIQYVRQEIDRLLSQSPSVPDKIVKMFNQQFPHAKHKPDVCSGVSTPDIAPSSPRFEFLEEVAGKVSSQVRRSSELYSQIYQQPPKTADLYTGPDYEAQTPAGSSRPPLSDSEKDP